MNNKFFIMLLVALVFTFAQNTIVFAQAVDEPLPDAAQEAEAREIMAGIRCLVCQNQSIEDSDADLAKDLRQIVREQVAAGSDVSDVHEFLLERYGDWILLEPPLRLKTIFLWFGPLVFLTIGVLGLYISSRNKKSATVVDPAPEGKAKTSTSFFEITKWHLLISIIGFAALSGVMYMSFGKPNLALNNMVTEDDGSDAELQALYVELQEYVERNPDNLDALGRFAEMSSRMGYLATAANTYGRLYALNPDVGVLPLVLQGEALVRQAQGLVTPAARLVFLKTISIEASHPAARYYLGLWFLQNDNSDRALKIWNLLKTESPADAPWLPMLNQQIAGVEFEMTRQTTSVGMAQPSAQDVAEVASMSEEDQQAFILSMVARLRARLENNHNDYEGWWRLAKVEAQLGNIRAALDALEQAESYAPAIKKAEISAEYLLLEQQLTE